MTVSNTQCPNLSTCLRLKAEEERLRKEEDRARREFIKQEYLRRKQLKLMEDLDSLVRPRPSSAAKQRRARPKSIHRDSLDSPKTPVRAATGNHGDVTPPVIKAGLLLQGGTRWFPRFTNSLSLQSAACLWRPSTWETATVSILRRGLQGNTALKTEGGGTCGK